MLSAAEEGNLEKIKELVSKNRLLLKCADKDGYTPLHRACYGNNIEVVEVKIELFLNIYKNYLKVLHIMILLLFLNSIY